MRFTQVADQLEQSLNIMVRALEQLKTQTQDLNSLNLIDSLIKFANSRGMQALLSRLRKGIGPWSMLGCKSHCRLCEGLKSIDNCSHYERANLYDCIHGAIIDSFTGEIKDILLNILLPILSIPRTIWGKESIPGDRNMRPSERLKRNLGNHINSSDTEKNINRIKNHMKSLPALDVLQLLKIIKNFVAQIKNIVGIYYEIVGKPDEWGFLLKKFRLEWPINRVHAKIDECVIEPLQRVIDDPLGSESWPVMMQTANELRNIIQTITRELSVIHGRVFCPNFVNGLICLLNSEEIQTFLNVLQNSNIYVVLWHRGRELAESIRNVFVKIFPDQQIHQKMLNLLAYNVLFLPEIIRPRILEGLQVQISQIKEPNKENIVQLMDILSLYRIDDLRLARVLRNVAIQHLRILINCIYTDINSIENHLRNELPNVDEINNNIVKQILPILENVNKGFFASLLALYDKHSFFIWGGITTATVSGITWGLCFFSALNRNRTEFSKSTNVTTAEQGNRGVTRSLMRFV